MQNKPEYTVLIPVYNSEKSLAELVERIKTVFIQDIKKSFEILFIDDASPNPKTWETLLSLQEKHSEIKILQLMRNFGKAGAVLCGFSEAKGEYIITIDDDLQHRPEDIPKLIEKQDNDIVILTFKSKKHGFSKRITSKIKSWFDYKFLKKPKHVNNSPYKLIKRDVIKNVLKIRSPYPFISGLLFFVTSNIVMVEGTHESRKYGKSDFNFKRRLKQFSNLLINNTPFLLRIIAYLGIVFSIISFFVGMFFIIKKVTVGTNASGWTSLIVLISFMSGIILFTLGVIGEYLIRIINTTENKSAFIIRKKKG